MNLLRLQFILKRREAGPYGSWAHDPNVPEGYTSTLSSGLRNSVLFIVNMLTSLGICAEMVEVIDNNCIDREVTRFKPTHVIIEAFWVVPEKFDVLKPLHPNIHWIVRSHSQSEFLALEGMAFDWTMGYLKRGVGVAANSEDAYADFKALVDNLSLDPHLVSYLPNYYPLKDREYGQHDYQGRHQPDAAINIGCFGAIRPLKNHLNQALAALQIAHKLQRPLFFHVNATRNEGGADPVLRNLRSLFTHVPDATLVEHPWMDHDQFLHLLTTIDLSMQVSFSETFNIVGADSVAAGVPLVASDQIPWIPPFEAANPNSVADIMAKGLRTFKEAGFLHRFRIFLQKHALHEYVEESKKIWHKWSEQEERLLSPPSHHHHHLE